MVNLQFGLNPPWNSFFCGYHYARYYHIVSPESHWQTAIQFPGASSDIWLYLSGHKCGRPMFWIGKDRNCLTPEQHGLLSVLHFPAALAGVDDFESFRPAADFGPCSLASSHLTSLMHEVVGRSLFDRKEPWLIPVWSSERCPHICLLNHHCFLPYSPYVCTNPTCAAKVSIQTYSNHQAIVQLSEILTPGAVILKDKYPLVN